MRPKRGLHPVEMSSFLCRFTQIAVLRLLTRKTVMGRGVQSMAGAWETYDRCCVDDRIGLLETVNHPGAFGLTRTWLHLRPWRVGV
jgi:hypothetical protein